MIRRTLWAAAFCGLLLPLGLWTIHAQEPKAAPAPAPTAKAEDVKSIDAIVAAVYDVISGDKGQARDWARFRSLFVPGARLIPIVPGKDGGARARVLDVEEFVNSATRATSESAFYERELGRKTDQYGRMAHVYSAYESVREKGGKPFDRGINSIELLKDGDRWWVVSIYWDRETPENPIPAEYLPKK